MVEEETNFPSKQSCLMGPMCDVRVAEKIQKVDRLKKKFRSEKKEDISFRK